jgi:hypothetical protein
MGRCASSPRLLHSCLLERERPALFFRASRLGFHISRGRQTAELGSGPFALGAGCVDKRQPKTTIRNGPYLCPLLHARQGRSGWVFLHRQSRPVNGGGRSRLGTAAAEMDDGYVRRLGVASFLWWQMIDESARQPFFLPWTDIRGIETRDAVRGGQCGVNLVSDSLAELPTCRVTTLAWLPSFSAPRIIG